MNNLVYKEGEREVTQAPFTQEKEDHCPKDSWPPTNDYLDRRFSSDGTAPCPPLTLRKQLKFNLRIWTIQEITSVSGSVILGMTL
ncbi:uncharacterized protein METZ01_LOCUS198631 [marine metagenome]|uniref:Uncharacterized protein n=1 Tax=marine metagenome TaxID=408172 RepID=A0A382E7C3_9ZZZZ